jgi:AraC family transcriptional regulator
LESSCKESAGSCRSGVTPCGTQGLLASSADLGWESISAELRTHARGELAWQRRQLETEVSVVTCPSNHPVTRSGGGLADRTIARRGTVWLCPPEDHRIAFSAPVPQILHIYLPSRHFSAESLGLDVDGAAPAAVRYERGFQDPLVAEIAYTLAAELRMQTTGGRLLAETLAISLAARLTQRHTAPPSDAEFAPISNHGLDRRRLTRVKEFIAANLEQDLTIAELAHVASLSRFHFARAFKAAVGQSPHQYVSTHRLERAKELLTYGHQSLLDIALALSFSSQANFTRAFHQSTGMTPGQYRRAFARG